MTEIFRKSPINFPFGPYIYFLADLVVASFGADNETYHSLDGACLHCRWYCLRQTFVATCQRHFQTLLFYPHRLCRKFCRHPFSLLISGDSLAALDKSALQLLSLPALALIALHKPQQKWQWYGLFFGTLGALFLLSTSDLVWA
ncbi:MAG: hypothetical protein IPH40_06870 [Polaromonas sp.]|nr:hypothetical protein [Polaromonas sp.]